MKDHDPRPPHRSRIADPPAERVLELSEGGATVPFIARYRKEATGIDEVQIQAVLDRAAELKDLDERR